MGATRLSVVCACALALVVAPGAVAATGDLAVSVSRLELPATIATGRPTALAVRYVVRGPASRRARATVVVVLLGTSNRFQITSDATMVRPAIWSWGWRDALPKVLGKGRYRVTVTVTLRRSGKTLSTAKRAGTTIVS